MVLDCSAEWSISTHALREEGDSRCGGRIPMRFYFYPRPP